MIVIRTNKCFLPEKEYVCEILFGEFLGLDYRIEIGNQRDYEVVLDNHRRILFRDGFFDRHSERQGYLALENCPRDVGFAKNQFLIEGDIPVVFGSDELKVERDGIVSGIDIFASAFFMLTRWEEYVSTKKDVHGRFPGTESLAYRSGFLDRPVVNEYAEMLMSMLRFLGYGGERKKRGFEMVLTHDVDIPLRWRGVRDLLCGIGGDIFSRRDLLSALDNVGSFVKSKLQLGRDPFDTFDYLMDLSEGAGVKSHFFFMGGGRTKYDNRYSVRSPAILKLIENIDRRGHKIGFHPSYDTYKNRELWREEYEVLSSISPQEIRTGRQHFLRCEIPITWEIWEENGMEWDSSLGYADREGFRCGACCEFSLFNILSRRKMRLKEKPLVAMDGSLVDYQKAAPAYVENRIRHHIDRAKKYKGEFVFLWHTYCFNLHSWKPYKYIYHNILK